MSHIIDAKATILSGRREFVSSIVKGAVAASSLSCLPAALVAESKRPTILSSSLDQCENAKSPLNIKITNVDIHMFNVAYIKPFRIALGLITSANNLLVRINTNAGVYGIGEASPYAPVTGENQETVFDAAVTLAKSIKGKNPLSIEERMKEMDAILLHGTTIKSAFDMALYDILGKVANLPLYAILGGGNRTIFTDRTVGLGTPEVMSEAAAKVQEMGFTAIKVKLGTNISDDLARIRAIRNTVGDQIQLRIDANQGWSYSDAIRIMTDLVPYGIQFCEQPLLHWNYEDMKALKKKTVIPLMADESVFNHHDAFKIAATDACDYINIKLAKSSGIHQALKINAVAEAAGMKCMLGCMGESRLGLTAGAHLVSARPNIEFVDLDSALSLKEDPVTGGICYEKGRIVLPDGPGLGADIDSEYLKKLKCVSI